MLDVTAARGRQGCICLLVSGGTTIGSLRRPRRSRTAKAVI